MIRENNGTLQGERLKDIAFAGDGEPTLVKELPELLQKTVEIKQEYKLDDCKINLFTNGSKIDRPDLQGVLPVFYKNQGEIWFKLDFWDAASFSMINRSAYPFERIVSNLMKTGKIIPLVLQSCFFSWHKEPFTTKIYQPYVEFIQSLTKAGVIIQQIQVYTIARKPAEIDASPWSNEDMDTLDKFLSERINAEIQTIYKSAAKK